MTKRPLTGVGLNLSPYYLATSFTQNNYFFDPAHPHNIIIQLLAESGLLGTTLFIIFVYLIYRPYIFGKNKKQSEFFFGSLIFLICAQIYPIFINHMEIVSYLFLYLGFASYYNHHNDAKK
jgi:O-antigen ligase